MGESRESGIGNREWFCPSPCEGRGRLGGGCVGAGATGRRHRSRPRNPSPTLPCLRRGGGQKRCAGHSRRTLPLFRIEVVRPVRLAAQQLHHQRISRRLQLRLLAGSHYLPLFLLVRPLGARPLLLHLLCDVVFFCSAPFFTPFPFSPFFF